MDTLTDYELAKLADLRWRIQRGDYDLDRMPDRRHLRAAYWLTENALDVMAWAMIVGFFVFLGGLFWIAYLASQPW